MKKKISREYTRKTWTKSINRMTGRYEIRADDFVIAVVAGGGKRGGPDVEQAAKIARLIKEAPVMLDALETLVGYAQSTEKGEILVGGTLALARAAIARTRGVE